MSHLEHAHALHRAAIRHFAKNADRAAIAPCRASQRPWKREHRVELAGGYSYGHPHQRRARPRWFDRRNGSSRPRDREALGTSRCRRRPTSRSHPRVRCREGWNNGFRSCAHWLSWRVGLDMGAAREKVRVARALGTLPRLAQALALGELSYAKVRALTRVATPETEERLLGVGRSGTAAHVERIVRGWRRVDRNAEARESAARHRSRTLRVYRDDDGMVVVRGRLEPEVGELLAQALNAAREVLYQRTHRTFNDARCGDVSTEPP